MTQGKYADVNGQKMYYEVHGSGRPLVLLHGALSAIGTSFGMLLPSLAKNKQAIAIDQQAHGRRADIVRPEQAVEMFRLLGGGVFGDASGLPPSQVAVLPGTTHITVGHRAGFLVSMIEEFLEAPTPDG
jgi:pimeloyl-ACP methyl ester carboxylesterase